MALFVFILYGLIIFSYIFFCLFITYHLIKYSLNSELNKIMLTTFVIVATLLFVSNLALFFSVNWQPLFAKIANLTSF
ncbi:MAG: hypothetical protein HGB08_04245 [Candidatus Moranbacteria bacterium]|nr:hypothetical protein [Candidatus Moranbacteria bacterium]